MNNTIKVALSLLALTTLAGCAAQRGCNDFGCYDSVVYEQPNRTQCSPSSSQCGALVVPDEIVVNVVGYGAPKNTFESAAQRRLMALRASELDAYRKLSEQISGVHIFGDTRVDDFIAQHDRIRSRLNTFIQGATITHQEFQSDGVAVTHMTMRVSRSQLQRMLERERIYQSRGLGLVPGGAFRDTLYYAPRY